METMGCAGMLYLEAHTLPFFKVPHIYVTDPNHKTSILKRGRV